MRQKDSTKKIMKLFRQLAIDTRRQEIIHNAPPDSLPSNWLDLVAKATGNGLDNMDIPELLLLAGYAKEVLKDKTYLTENK